MTASRPHGAKHGDLVDALGTAVAGGTIPPGTVLTLDGIARDHGVSLPVAREAVRVLTSMGLLTSRRRVGVTVLAPDQWNVFDPRLIRWRLDGPARDEQLRSLSELRRGVEPAAAALAARRATPEQCAAMAAAVSDMVVLGRARDLQAYLAADIRFHDALLEASGNEMLRSLAGVVGEVLTGRTEHDLMPARPREAAIALHDDVARAVRLGRPDEAEAAMRAIIDEATAAMAVDEPADPADPPRD